MSRSDSRANAERILAAVRRLWADHATVSVEQVAAEAGVGVATVYRHFPNRTALESAAFARIFAEELEPVVRSADSGTDLIDVAERFIEVIGRYAPVLGAVGVTQVTDDALTELSERFVALLRDGQTAGVLTKELEPVDMYWILRMAVLGLTSPLASVAVRRRYVAMILTALSPGESGPWPSLEVEDYDRLGVPPEHRSR